MENQQIFIGTVKWFGGHNRNTDRENPFGFIAKTEGDDLFVHKKQLKNKSNLDEGELVLFQIEKTPKGLSASNVYSMKPERSKDIESLPLNLLATVLASANDLDELNRVPGFLTQITSYIKSAEVGAALLPKLIEKDVDKLWLLNLLNRTRCDNQLYEIFFRDLSFDEYILSLKDLTLAPQIFLEKHIVELATYLNALSDEERVEQVDKLIKTVSFNMFLFLVFKNVVNTQNKIYKFKEQLTRFVEATILGQKQDFKIAEYVREAYSTSFESFTEYCQHPLVEPIASPLLVKRKIFKRDMTFIKDIKNNTELANNFEFWFLATLIPLLYQRNATDVIEPVILTSLWQKLLDVNSDVDEGEVFALFPYCYTAGENCKTTSLSCEAFHWRTPDNEDKFLCRSKICSSPKVVPDLSKSFIDYSVFDWLAHYGYHYFEQSKPAKRDFPIKLAAYINRVRELKDKLDCRCCGQLMIPNMNYARVEVTTVNEETGEETTVPMQASYRLTVFKCNNHSCQEFEKSYYFNHCLNYKCYTIIDSRDDLNKCSEDRYHCPDCGSCCGTHAEKSKFRN